MAAKPENTFIGAVHKHVPPEVYRMKTNNPYIAGIPDCYYSGNKGELWVEYKFIPKIPLRANVQANLSALQLHWLRGRASEGRNVAVVIGGPEGGLVLHNPKLWGIEIAPAEFRDFLVSRASVADWIALQTTRAI